MRFIKTGLILLCTGLMWIGAGNNAFAQEKGAVIGGYGELHYNDVTAGLPESQSAGQLDFHRFILYAGYNFNDWISFQSELELEHTLLEGDEGGEVALEQAYVDMRYSPEFGVRAGIMLVPVGIVNPVHEPPTFNGVERPNVEKYIIPSTWRESGIGVYGKFRNGLSYQAYLMAGLDASGINGAEGIREARQNGFESSVDNIGFTGRVDYRINLKWNVGASFFYSDLQTDALYGEQLDGVRFGMLEGHLLYTDNRFEARGLVAISSISNADKLNNTFGKGAGKGQFGSYVELAYDLLPSFKPETEQQLFAFARYDVYDTNFQTADGLQHVDNYQHDEMTLGLTYKPTPQVAFKMDYQFLGTAGEKDIEQFNLGVGYNF